MPVVICLFEREGTSMAKTIGGALLGVALVFGVFVATQSTAQAQWRNGDYRDDRYRNRGYGGNNNYDLNQGYQQGINTGSSDARRGQSYSPQRSHYYRDARSQAFRQGFVRGYAEGYRQYSGGGYGGYGNGRYGNGRNGGYGGYGNGGYGNGGYNNGGYNDRYELDRGYQQGVSTGASDAQRRQSYDPQRSRYYRNASTPAFREGFVRGYDEGFRRYGYGGYRRGNSTGDILGRILGLP